MENPSKADLARPLLAEAKALYAEILEAEKAIRLKRDELLTLALQMGKILVTIKDEIGHGKWLFWLGGHWPQLGEKNAQRCMALARENPKSEDSSDLSEESVRKFMWGYIPAKQRAELEGDQKIAPAAHHLTPINHFWKWERQLKIGHVAAPPVEVMQREFEPVVRRLAELLGRDYVLGLLG